MCKRELRKTVILAFLADRGMGGSQFQQREFLSKIFFQSSKLKANFLYSVLYSSRRVYSTVYSKRTLTLYIWCRTFGYMLYTLRAPDCVYGCSCCRSLTLQGGGGGLKFPQPLNSILSQLRYRVPYNMFFFGFNLSALKIPSYGT
jgi:hypothetical protein